GRPHVVAARPHGGAAYHREGRAEGTSSGAGRRWRAAGPERAAGARGGRSLGTIAACRAERRRRLRWAVPRAAADWRRAPIAGKPTRPLLAAPRRRRHATGTRH